ncbi:PIN domain-containing protein [Variovorax sp. J22P168]|uniref:PIN domain-containing protein n=1 Tax=Variovorax jilinensis TaxID=3053513 RepID=UPI002574D34A|nr:PIN domain-containing protein [Variovorax sp. J22P168]MDM0013444.1 PIN domain-containing protein [Variovorax sp. J22P168]
MALQTRNVFIDTQSFVKAGLDFRSKAIRAFADAAGDDEFNHLMTTISVQEVKNKIHDAIKEGLGRVMDFRRKAKMLETSTNPVIAGFFAAYDQASVQSHAQDVFQEFIDDSNATVLDLSKVDANEVFRRYFQHEAPFQEGKKKDEFPDAFSMLAIEANLKNDEECYVVSEDSDLMAFCAENKRFLLIEDLASLLDLYNSHDEERATAIKSYLAIHDEQIRKEIADEVERAEFYNVSTWDDAEVHSHTVIGVDNFDPDIISMDDETCLVSFDVAVHYEVVVEGPDFINGYYDREEDRMYAAGKSRREESSSLDVSVEIEMFFEVQENKFVITDMIVQVPNLGSGIEIAVEETESYY